MTNPQSALSNWARVHGDVDCSGVIKQHPADFIVEEQMDVTPSGSGEHVWLSVRKTKQNTDAVAKQLARFANVAYRDVGYSGLKDFFATTTQWFSVWLPKGDEPSWRDLENRELEILDVSRHHRKIKRGTHRANKFQIRIRELNTDVSDLERRLSVIAKQGVPNYFGEQRFGRNGNNVEQALEMFAGESRVKNRNHRSLLISSARSLIFNNLVSHRVEQGNWSELLAGEPANLDGTGSIFTSVGDAVEQQRLSSLDIHPTAAMWGQLNESTVQVYADLHAQEQAIAMRHPMLVNGLLKAGLKYQRRPLRCRVTGLSWNIESDQVWLEFSLQKGQFATAVLREIVSS